MKRSPMPRMGVFVCADCGGRFQRRADRPSRRADGVVLCLPCGKAAHVPVVDNSGERNPNYRHGRRTGTFVSKPVVRRAVIDRDGNWCLICGAPGPGLHLHRVRYGSEGGDYEQANCVQLCGAHHALVHSSKRTWKPLLLEYLEQAEAGAKRPVLRRLRHLAKAAA
jgi:5-methylcytosine-specific restriction endonuclease McrA